MVSGSLRNGSLSECTSFLRAKFRRRSKPCYIPTCYALLIKTIGCGNVSLWLTRLPAVLASLLLWGVGVKSISLIFHDRKFTIAAACFLAFCPYYIMSGRLALDCNLMLCCISCLPAVFAEIHSDQQTSFFNFLWYFFFGFTMYSYALSYFMVPIFLVLITLYLLYTRKITFPRAILFAITVCIMAIPVILLPALFYFNGNRSIFRVLSSPQLLPIA